MDRLIPEKNNILINKIDYTEDFFNEFKKRLFLALQKYQSSRKTKLVHQLIENNNIEMALFTGNNEDIGKVMFKENNLYMIYLNAVYFADFAGNDIISYFTKIIDIVKRINEEKDIISSQRIYNLNKLNEEYKSYMQKFLDSFDYIKIIDGIYYMVLYYFFLRVYSTNIQKTKTLLMLNSQYLSKFIQKMYTKLTRINLDNPIKEKINIITDYFILVYYFGEPVNYAIKKIEKVYNKEAAEFLRKSNHLKCEDFENLADILFETDTLKIQKNVFNMLFKKEFGELGFTLLKQNKTTADAFICSLNHKNVLFNAISADEKIGFNIEELILNEKSRINFIKQIKKFI